jgi:hypothetical protein
LTKVFEMIIPSCFEFYKGPHEAQRSEIMYTARKLSFETAHGRGRFE